MPKISVNGHTIEYADEGDGPLTVLLHCSASSHAQWGALIPELARVGRVIAPSLIGYGETSAWARENPQSVTDQARAANDLLDHLGVSQAPFDIVGHSFGAVVALEVALLQNDRVQKLALFEPNPFALLRHSNSTEELAEVLSVYRDIKDGLSRGDRMAAARCFTDYFVGAGFWPSLPEPRKQSLARDLLVNVNEWDAVLAEEIVPNRWQPLKAKVMIVSAADTQPALRSLVKITRKHNPGWHHEELVRGGHMAPLTRARDFNSCVMSFLNRA